MQRPLRRVLASLAVTAGALVLLSSAQGGAFSGGNGVIAFSCGPDICTINPDGTGRTPLIASASDPSYSTDSTGEIAYVDATGIADAFDDGSLPASLGAPGGTQPTFSFSGNTVAFIKSSDIFTINSDTSGNEQQLTNTASIEADPAYSPDGTQIAYSSNVSGNYDIRIITVGSGISFPVTSVAGDERSPTWSPDGSTLVYSSAGELFKVAAAANSTPTDLHVAGTDPTFSPDGTKIAYINAASHLAVVSSGGTGTQVVLDTITVDAQPDWQESSVGGTGPPVNVNFPSINLQSGDSQPVVGHFVTASVGTWDGAFPITYQYQWKRCVANDPLNGPCADIAGATSSFYTPVGDDAGMRLRVQVTASNGQGSAAQNSESSAVVVALPVKLRSTPEIFGDATVDSTLSLTDGVWDGSTPIAFTYSWRRCDPVGDLVSCVPISGASDNTYTPTVQDIGFSLRVWITGTNVAGSDSAITNHTFPVVDKAHFSPGVVTAPSVAGELTRGRQLTADVGTFSGDLPIKTTFVWERCDATGSACRVIKTAKKVVYFPTAADVGFTLRVSVTATNSIGKSVVLSDPTDPVSAAPPNVRGRRIVGTNKGEYLAGGAHDDVIFGRGGNDTLLGGAGDDRIYGGAGNDVITGGAGADHLYGGAGSDTIFAADGERDVVNCGPGRDRAVVDSVDTVTGCEVVVRSP